MEMGAASEEEVSRRHWFDELLDGREDGCLPMMLGMGRGRWRGAGPLQCALFSRFIPVLSEPPHACQRDGERAHDRVASQFLGGGTSCKNGY